MKKDSKYIAQVLSHLKSKQQKDEVEWELLDHLAEKEARLTNIGYGAEETFARAEEEMGDGDIAGEQLQMIHMEHTWQGIRCVLFGLFSILSFAAFWIYNFAAYGGEVFTFLNFILWNLVFQIALGNLIIGIRKKRIFNSIAGCLSAALLFILYPNAQLLCIRYLFAGRFNEIAENFYYHPNIDIADPLVLTAAQQSALQGIGLIFIFLLTLLGIVLKKRVRSFRNTRTDLHVSKAACVVCIGIMSVFAILFSVTAVQTITLRSNVMEQTRYQILQTDKLLVEHLDSFAQIQDDKALRNWCISTFPDGQWDEDANRFQFGDIFVSWENDTAVLDFHPSLPWDWDRTALSCWKKSDQTAIEQFAEEHSILRTLDIPGILVCEHSPSGCYLTVQYGVKKDTVFDHTVPVLIYAYAEQTGFSLIGNSVGEKEEVTLTKQQCRAIEQVFPSSADDFEIEEYFDYLDIDCRTFTEVYRCEKFGSVYNVYLYYRTGYFAIVEGNLYDLNPSNFTNYTLLQVVFDGKSAYIINNIYYEQQVYRDSVFQRHAEELEERYQKRVEEQYGMPISENRFKLDTETGEYELMYFDESIANKRGRLEKRTKE